ncbi:MAG: sporulation protein, partial [Erysipelotrichaceae bacterium]
NTIIDSMNKSESINVKGKVYAYTWYTINVEIDEKNSIDAFDYFKLLFEARRTIAKEIGEGEKIIKENVLQFEPKVGKMNMQVHYTLLEVIGTS